MDALAGGKMALALRPAHRDVAHRFKMHFDARQFAIEESHVLPVRQ